MSGDKNRFMNLKQYDRGSVKFGNNDGAKIVGKGAVQLNHGKITSKEVLFVNGLKHSLLSVSHISDQGHEVVSKKLGFEIRKSSNGKVVAVGSRTSSNLYTLSKTIKEKCAIGQVDERRLWHRRLGHIRFDNLSKIHSKEANRCMLRPHEEKTLYELWFGRKAIVKHLKVFGSKCYIKRIEKNVGTFDEKADEGIFLGYSTRSKAYRCYNKRLNKIVETIDVKFDEQVEQPENSKQELLVYEDSNDDSEPVAQYDDRKEGESEDHSDKKRENSRWHEYHGTKETNILGDAKAGIQTRRMTTSTLARVKLVVPMGCVACARCRRGLCSGRAMATVDTGRRGGGSTGGCRGEAEKGKRKKKKRKGKRKRCSGNEEKVSAQVEEEEEEEEEKKKRKGRRKKGGGRRCAGRGCRGGEGGGEGKKRRGKEIKKERREQRGERACCGREREKKRRKKERKKGRKKKWRRLCRGLWQGREDGCGVRSEGNMGACRWWRKKRRKRKRKGRKERKKKRRRRAGCRRRKGEEEERKRREKEEGAQARVGAQAREEEGKRKKRKGGRREEEEEEEREAQAQVGQAREEERKRKGGRRAEEGGRAGGAGAGGVCEDAGASARGVMEEKGSTCSGVRRCC
ncbi:hypothetical protein MRB53_022690 [Persea americana]|uniref:Uncharacterized protein n=1 Tax=Persea americana TaxID=3435 RepID=A0ACC2L7B6_PERAE|nr:hypothetical protein MRB53_022690 [Persea americana]